MATKKSTSKKPVARAASAKKSASAAPKAPVKSAAPTAKKSAAAKKSAPAKASTKKVAKPSAATSKPAPAAPRKAASERAHVRKAAPARTNSKEDSSAPAVSQDRKSSPNLKKKRWNLRLYIAGDSPRSRTALSNLRRLCEERLADDYDIEVIDLAKMPHLAKTDQILAVPTLVRSLPEPMKRLIGDLSDSDRALVALDMSK